MVDRVLEDGQAGHGLIKETLALTGPLRVLGGGDVAFGVRHQAEDHAGRVADARDVIFRAVGVRAAPGSVVSQRDLVVGFELSERFCGGGEPAFAMRDRQLKVAQAFRPDTRGALGFNHRPPLASKPPRVVVRQRRDLLSGLRERQQPQLHQHLKPVADPDHRHATFRRVLQRLKQAVFQSVGEDAPRSDVVAVAEPAGETDEVELADKVGLFDEFGDVDRPCRRPGLLKGISQFSVAVRARGTDD